MSIEHLKKVVAKLPLLWQQRIKRIHYWNQIRNGKFISDEPEFRILSEIITKGDWAIDVGANVGHYTIRLSKLVGNSGRIIAIEPVPDTFVLLAENIRQVDGLNVTLLNVAASDKSEIAGMHIPLFESGLKNYFQAQLTFNNPDIEVVAISLDSLDLKKCIRLVKIDAEGQEIKVLNGMRKIIERDHPILIIEVGDRDTIELLRKIGYKVYQLPKSPNMVFKYINNKK